ncbi:MAG: pyruvate kinase [Bacteroidetes bacterium]|nr:pyruvate kinase [Bacteroidota bacterium]
MYKSNFNKTKIIATIGPATSSREMIKNIVLAGVDVCRLNFSHGNYADHEEVIQNIRSVNEELNSDICILQDLQGPKLRVGLIENDGVILVEGTQITLTSKEEIGTAERICIRYINLTKDVKPGESILLDDGKLEVRIDTVLNEHDVLVTVIQGGILKPKKGFNLPHTDVSFPSLTEKDLEDLAFGLAHNVEWIGLSFTRTAEDIIALKKLIAAAGKETRVVAKIEKPEAVKNIDSIIEVSDAIMIARGDLGVELPFQDLPLIQKNIIEKCLAAGKPVIVATQMMETMITNSTPTRAEVSDVANAVIDGADAVMLSGETSVGDFPVKVVETMEKIIRDVENDRRVYFKGIKPVQYSNTFISDEICFTAVRMSDHLNAKAIVGMTRSGYSANKISSFRPKANIYIFTSHKPLLKTMNLVWGVRGFYYDKFESTDQTFSDVIEKLTEEGMVKSGDRVIHTASMPIKNKSMANSIKISIID